MEDLVMFGGAFSGRRVFVTGHTGFKGSWLAYWLTRLGADVTGYALDPPTDPSLFADLGLAALLDRHVVADVRADRHLREALRATKPSVVYHLAAQPLVRQSYDEPAETFATNVMGTVNLLEAVRECGTVPAVVVVTSDKCYQNQEDGRPFVEEDAMGGRDPYSASKGCAELATAAYAGSFFSSGGTAVATARAGNVIGGGDWAADRIVPDCVRALTAGDPVSVRNPDAIRPWQHVLESLAGYLTLGAALLGDGHEYGGAWNFGPGPEDDGRTVGWVVNRFLDEWGAGSWTTPGHAGVGPHEAHHLGLDSTKANQQLGWTPVWDAATAVSRTAAWYCRRFRDSAGARELVDHDLDRYAADAALKGISWATA